MSLVTTNDPITSGCIDRLGVDFALFEHEQYVLDRGLDHAARYVPCVRGGTLVTFGDGGGEVFLRQLYRFYLGRDEIAADDPLLRTMFFNFANNDEQAIVRLLQTLGNAPAFSQRTEAP